ncbi:MAG: hypothetical protein ACRD2J_01010 [Thermoanaerobaculia bacterium]
MKRLLLAAVACVIVSGCATAAHEHDHGTHRYKACNERIVGGRVLHDPGWVVEEHLDAGTGHRIYHFLSSYWNRIIEVTRVNRFCSLASSSFDAGAREPAPIAIEPVRRARY